MGSFFLSLLTSAKRCNNDSLMVASEDGFIIVLLSVDVDDDVNALSTSWPRRKRGLRIFSLHAAANAAIAGFGSPLGSMFFTSDFINSESDLLEIKLLHKIQVKFFYFKTTGKYFLL